MEGDWTDILLDEEGVWQAGKTPRKPLRHGPVVALAGCLGLLGAVAGFEAHDSGGGGGTARVSLGTAASKVMSALSSTLAAGRWDMAFATSFMPPPGISGSQGLTIIGHGTTNLNPFRMVAHCDVAGIGAVTTYLNGSTVWEVGGGQYGATAGASIAGFAPSVEGSLGPEEGAVAMLGLASATGYLDLVQQAVASASPTGSGTVDGTPITSYEVSVDPTQLLGLTGTTPEEESALHDALSLLHQNGFGAMNDAVSVDDQGYIRAITQLVTFADGGVVTQRTTFSNFGRAATVALPGSPSYGTTGG